MKHLITQILAVVAVLAVLFVGVFFYRQVRGVRESAQRTQIAGYLKHLSIAMHMYHEVHQTLPPHAIYSKEGKPLLSWRVLLLPYMEEDALFKKFKLDEPWDSPHNIKLLAEMPRFYAPVDGRPTPQPHSTFFQVFVGPGAAFDGPVGFKLPDDFPDGMSSTLLLAHAGDAVPWTKPDDLPYSPRDPLPKLRGLFPGTFQAAMVDTVLRHVPDRTSEATLRALITRNGGEKLGAEWK